MLLPIPWKTTYISAVSYARGFCLLACSLAMLPQIYCPRAEVRLDGLQGLLNGSLNDADSSTRGLFSSVDCLQSITDLSKLFADPP